MMDFYYNIFGFFLLATSSLSTIVDGRECPAVPPKLSSDRLICPGAFNGITPQQCMDLSADCCYDSSTWNVAWCYKPAMYQTQFVLRERLQMFFVETATKPDVRRTFTQAKSRCENDFRGSLAIIKNQQDLDVFDTKVTSINVSTPHPGGMNELWVGGRTDRDIHSMLSLSNNDVKVSGQNCIVLSDYSPPNTTRGFNLYSKGCTDSAHWGSICAKDISITKKFIGKSKNYILKLGTRTSHANSLSQCLHTYNGTSLGKIVTNDTLATVTNELLQTTNLSFTVWVDGKTDKSGHLDYEDVKDTGTNCVVLKQGDGSSYALYSARCSEESNKGFLCEQSIDERLKFDLKILVENEVSKTGQAVESELCYRLPKSNYIKKGETRNIQCKSPVEGRYVKILSMAPKGFLTLVEVQVLGRRAFPRVYGGNATAEKCVLPFIYNGTSHEDCITTNDRPRLWCATTANYDQDFVWGYCIDVKLSGGRRKNEGRVQVRGPSKVWGTVCDDDWDDAEANVVCKRLGYPAGGRAVYPSFFETGIGSITLGNLKCNGSEPSLCVCPHEKNPRECGHNEDAAVICTQTDTTSLIGYPNDKRSQQDHTIEGVVIMQSTQEVKVPGKITAWKFYSVKKGPVLKLQVWRRVYDLKGFRFMMIAQIVATAALTDDGPVTVSSPVAINVQSGDLLGFSFQHGNPVSYDNTFHCKKHGKIKFSRNYNVTLGSSYTFSQKGDDDQKNCRMYSLFVEIETHRRIHLQEFTLNNKLYTIFTSKQRRTSIKHLCKINMGDTASLFQIETDAEFQYTKQKLGEIGVTGTFLTGNTVEQTQFDTSWAPCQPEEGKECVVISNDNKDQEYLWYTRSCADQYYYICVKNMAADDDKPKANDGNPNVKSTPPANKTTTEPSPKYTIPVPKEQISGKNDKHLALSIALPIFFLILIAAAVAVGLLYLRQRHAGKQMQDLLPAFMTPKGPTEIENPLYSDDVLDCHEHPGIKTNPQTGTVEVDLKAVDESK